jgi:hypothetical protein
MAADGTPGTKNQPQFLGGGAPATAVDYNLVSDYAAKVGNRRVGTTTERTTAAAADVWEGLEWHDTTLSTIFVYVSGSWVPKASLWATFTPTVTGLTLGTAGVLLYANKHLVNGNEEIRIGWRLGTSGFSVGDIQITPPTAFASWLSALVAPLGPATLIDASAGASGRYLGALYPAATLIRVATLGTSALQSTLSATAPFTWAASDEIHVAATYPVQ